MEANISAEQYPDMDFMEEYISLQGYEDWLRYTDAPPFGKFAFLESFVRPDEEIEGLVNTQFNVHIDIPHSILNVFAEGMESRGWEEIRFGREAHPLLDIKETHEKNYQDPSEKQTLGKFGQGKSKMDTRALLKAFERTSQISFTITFSENNPHMFRKLMARKEGK